MKKAVMDLSAEMSLAAKESIRRRGSLAWYDKLPPDARAEVEQIKAKYLAGEYGELPKRHAAKVLQKWLTARAFPLVGEWAIVRWLMDRG
jgi:hypothetical protein